jgi:cobalt transporter subunit CbtA
MIQKVFINAVIAGFAAGLIAATLHLFFIQPLLLEAELYESGALIHGGQNNMNLNPDVHSHEHKHLEVLARNSLTVLFLCLIYVSYSLILAACFGISEYCKRPIKKHTGIIWGICGFAALQLFPAFGLPPEVPGSSSANIEARQLWWVLTAIATAIGLAAVFWNKSIAVKIIGLGIISVPHIIGAPAPKEFQGVVPPELASHFASRSIAAGFIIWTFLGVFLTHLWIKKSKSA